MEFLSPNPVVRQINKLDDAQRRHYRTKSFVIFVSFVV